MSYLPVIFFVLALCPAGLAALITGDFSQLVYKPTTDQIYFVLRNRRRLAAASAGFWLIGLILSLTVYPVPNWIPAVSALITAALAAMGWIMPGYVLFRGVMEPHWLAAEQADRLLRTEEPVIGLTAAGQARAIPIRWIHRPHLVYDQIGEDQVTITYCLLSNSAMTFRTGHNGSHLEIFTPLQWENNMMLYDPKRGQLYQQLNGEVLVGPEQGLSLERLPTRIMPWSAWRKLHPDTAVLHHPPRGLFDRIVRRMTGKLLITNRLQDAPIFPTIRTFDDRLPKKAEVLGVEFDGAQRAYPLELLSLKKVVNDELAGLPLLLVYEPYQDVAEVFVRRVAGQTLHFQQKSDGELFRLVDRETGSTWSLGGEALDGSLAGSSLEPYPHLNRVLWFSWSNFHPQSEIFVQEQPAPQPESTD